MSEYPPTYPPPSYGFANPNPSSHIIKDGSTPAQSQPQWGQPAGFIAAQPVIITQDLSSIENYVVWSVLNILCCCWILGCVACFFTIQTDNAKKNGDLQGALNNSRTARTINIIATCLGVVLNIFVILFYAGAF